MIFTPMVLIKPIKRNCRSLRTNKVLVLEALGYPCWENKSHKNNPRDTHIFVQKIENEMPHTKGLGHFQILDSHCLNIEIEDHFSIVKY